MDGVTSRVTFNTTRSASVCSSVGSYTEASHETNLEIQAEQTHTMCLFKYRPVETLCNVIRICLIFDALTILAP